MTAYYDLLDNIKAYLEGNSNINTVNVGEVFDVDLSQKTIFPLANIDTESVVFNTRTITFSVNILCMDIVDETKRNEKDQFEPFIGANNLIDIKNTQLAVINGLQSSLRRGGMFSNRYVLDEDISVSARPFQDRFENLLAGWQLTLEIDVPNDKMRDINADGSSC